MRERVWAADRFTKRGLPHNERCVLCSVVAEDAEDPLVGCSISNIIWSKSLGLAGLFAASLAIDAPFLDRWSLGRTDILVVKKKKLNSIVVLVT